MQISRTKKTEKGSLKKIFCPAADISGYSDEELAEFINDSIRDFVLNEIFMCFWLKYLVRDCNYQ